jgi:hypothetical protein
MPLPRLTPVPPQSQPQQTPLPMAFGGVLPPALTWVRVSQYVVNPAALDTTPGGNISIPPGYNHAMIIWLAKDTSANTTGSFGGLQLACKNGAIDTGNNYNWSEMVSAGTPASGVGAAAINAIVTAGGAGGANNWNRGTIVFPFYSQPGVNVTLTFDTGQANPGQPIRRSGFGEYFGVTGPLTKLHFFATAGLLAAGTTFDLHCAV